MMAAPWRFGDAPWASLVVLAAVAATSAEASHTAHLTFGTTFGNTNVKPNNTYSPPTRPPVVLLKDDAQSVPNDLETLSYLGYSSHKLTVSLLIQQPRMAVQELYTSKLSTNGIKQNGNQNHTTQPPPVYGKDCKHDRDCAGLQNTTCQLDSRDQKKRCLCFDKSSPKNGACTHSRKGPRSACSEDHECIRNAVCVSVNGTSSAASQKTCQCKGYYDEEDHECDSGGVLRVAPACIVAACLLAAYRGL